MGFESYAKNRLEKSRKFRKKKKQKKKIGTSLDLDYVNEKSYDFWFKNHKLHHPRKPRSAQSVEFIWLFRLVWWLTLGLPCPAPIVHEFLCSSFDSHRNQWLFM